MSLNTGNAILSNGITLSSTYNVGIGNPSSIEGVLTIKGTSAQPPSSGTTANSLLQLVGSLGSEINIGSNTVTGGYGGYIQVNDNNLAVPYQLNLQPNGGSVGIGTGTVDLSSGAILDVRQSNTGNMSISFMNTYGATSSTAQTVDMSFKLVGSGLTGQIGSMIRTGKEGDYSSGGARDAYLAFSTAIDDSLTEKLRISSEGNLLVTSGATIYNTSGNLYMRAGTSGDLILGAGGSNDKLRITSNGYTWINGAISGFTGSAVQLQVNGQTRFGGDILLHNGSNVAQAVRLSCGGADSLSVQGNTSVYNNFYCYNSTDGKSYGFTNLGDGLLSFTSVQFGVKGNFNAFSGVYTATSDINIKKDFEESNIGLAEILALKPTLFRYKDDPNEESEKDLGFIAQQVKEFIPQAYQESGSFIGLQDRPIIAALVKAIQELNTKIDQQQQTINSLINR